MCGRLSWWETDEEEDKTESTENDAFSPDPSNKPE